MKAGSTPLRPGQPRARGHRARADPRRRAQRAERRPRRRNGYELLHVLRRATHGRPRAANMMRLFMHRFTGRALALVVFETVLIVSAVAVGGLRAARRVERGTSWSDENGIGKTLLVAGVARCACTTPTCTTCGRVGSARAVRPDRAGAGGGVVHAGRAVLLVPRADHRPRRVHDCRVPRHHAGHRLAAGVRVAEPARRAARAAAARRHQTPRPWRSRASCSSGATNSASRSSASSIRIRAWSARR